MQKATGSHGHAHFRAGFWWARNIKRIQRAPGAGYDVTVEDPAATAARISQSLGAP